MFLNLINGCYFMNDGKVIWDILGFINKFWKVTTKLFGSNWISKICWIEVFFEMIKDFFRGTFCRNWFQSRFSVDRRWIDLSRFCFKILLAFWAICWSFKSYSSFNMISSCLGWYNYVFSHIGNVSSVAEFIEEIKQLFITELVEFRLRFSTFLKVVFTNVRLF